MALESTWMPCDVKLAPGESFFGMLAIDGGFNPCENITQLGPFPKISVKEKKTTTTYMLAGISACVAAGTNSAPKTGD